MSSAVTRTTCTNSYNSGRCKQNASSQGTWPLEEACFRESRLLFGPAALHVKESTMSLPWKFARCHNRNSGYGVFFLRQSFSPHQRSGAATISRYNSSVSSTAADKSSGSSNSSPSSVPLTLKHVPSLPFLGSMIPQHSGIKLDLANHSDTWRTCRQKYGDFYTIGTLHVVNDPLEMQKVLRSEGKFPTSSVMDLWTFRQFQDDYGQLGRAAKFWATVKTGAWCDPLCKRISCHHIRPIATCPESSKRRDSLARACRIMHTNSTCFCNKLRLTCLIVSFLENRRALPIPIPFPVQRMWNFVNSWRRSFRTVPT
jgi:hypothetical protein